MVQPECIGNSGTISGHVKQPAKIGPGPNADRLDGKPCAHHCGGIGIRCRVWLNPDAAHRFFLDGSGSDPSDLRPWRQQKGCAIESIAARVRAADLEQYEGECGLMLGWCDHRRIPGSKERSGVSDHLWQPGIPAGLRSSFDCTALPVFGIVL